MDTRAIGIFDSGMGGLTAVRALRRALPHENIVYLGDTARVPYGGRSVAELREIARSNTEFLLSRGVKAILVACGTVSSNCIDTVEFTAGEGIGVNGVVTPAVRAALKSGGRIGVLATVATAKSGAFARQILAASAGTEVISAGTHELVPLVESGRTSSSDEGVRSALSRALEPFFAKRPDTMILGCTHFPLLAEAISELLPGTVLIDSGECGALECARGVLARSLCREDENAGTLTLCTTGDAGDFSEKARLFIDDAPEAEHVELM